MKKRTRRLAMLLSVACVSTMMQPAIMTVYGTENDMLIETMSLEQNTISSQDLSLEDSNETVDEADDDQDGLINYWEEVMGTDKANPDTDGDGLNDYQEVYILGTDPLLVDTNEDGISDADTDSDGDGLTDLEEVQTETNPFLADSDNDGLTDLEERNNYGTDPVKVDSDGDGATDGFEVEHGYDPLAANVEFTVTVTSEDDICSLEVTGTGSVVESVVLTKTGSYTAEESVGAFSDIYEVTANGSFTKGILMFTTDAQKTEKPVVYSYNPENETMELTACTTSLVGDLAKTFITEPGKYILKSKTVIKEQENENIDAIEKSDLEVTVDMVETDTTEEITYLTMNDGTDSNEDGISDEYTKLLCDGTILTGGGNQVFGNLTYEEVQSKDDLDADKLLNGDEVKLAKAKDGHVYAVLNASPVLMDTDEDGIHDADDTAPFTTGLKDGVIGSLRVIGHHDNNAIFMEGHAYLVYTSYVDNQTVTVDNLYGAFYLNEDYRKAITEDPMLMLWSTTVAEQTPENDAYRDAVAFDMWHEQPAGTESIVLNRGEYVSIGDYNMVTWAKAISDALLNGESGTMMEYAAIQAAVEALTGKKVDVTYIMTHINYYIGLLSLESYIEDKDLINGNTDGGIWFNRELESQKYQYNQYPNNVYEIDVTQQQVDDMLTFVENNNYYSALSHNCSTVATGAWNAAVGYERDENGAYVTDANGNNVPNGLYLTAEGSGIFSIMDLPAVVSDNIIAISQDENVTEGAMLGELMVVRGCDVLNTVNTDVHNFEVYTKPDKGQEENLTITATSTETKKFRAEWNEIVNVDGYEISYAETADFKNAKKKDVAGSANTSYMVKSLTGGKTYYVRVRTYIKDASGKKVYGEYSNTASVICRPAAVKISTTKAVAAGKTMVKWIQEKNVSGYEVTYGTGKDLANSKTVTVKNAENVSTTIENLHKNQSYYVAVRAYVTEENGTKIFGDYGDVKKMKVK